MRDIYIFPYNIQWCEVVLEKNLETIELNELQILISYFILHDIYKFLYIERNRRCKTVLEKDLEMMRHHVFLVSSRNPEILEGVLTSNNKDR